MSLEPGCVAADNRAESKASLLHSDPYLIALVQASDVGRLDAITLQFLIDGGGRCQTTISGNHSVHLSLANRTYQKWPTWKLTLVARTSLKQVGLLTYLKFENRLRAFRPQGL